MLKGIYTDVVSADEKLIDTLDKTHMERFAAVPKTLMINQWTPDQRWLQLDATYPDQIAKRLEALQAYPEKVIERLDADYVRAGEYELRDRVAAYLLDNYPNYFKRQGDLILSLTTGLAVDVGPDGADPMVAVAALASEDFLLLFPDSADGDVRLRSGVLASPNDWSLRSHFNEVAPSLQDTVGYRDWAERLKESQRKARFGKTPREIHEGIVPHYMKHFADRVDMFFRKMPPDMMVWRRNWGLWTTDKLFLHADVPLPDMPAETPDNWLAHGYMRSEHETFTRLPKSNAILFGIKTYIWKFSDVLNNPVSRDALITSNDNLSPEMFEYRKKPLTTFRPLLDRYRDTPKI
jgi:hypothetical protein